MRPELDRRAGRHRRPAMGAPPSGRARDLHHGRPSHPRELPRRRRHAGILGRGPGDRAAAAPHGDAVRRPGRRHRALRRRGGGPGRGPGRPDPDEPDPRGGSRPPARDASAGRRERAGSPRPPLPHGLHYVPDPSSQAACTVGGNVAENAGGPHCLKYGVTTNHVVELEVVLPDAAVVRLGSARASPGDPTWSGSSWAARGCSASPRDHRAPGADSSECAYHARRLLDRPLGERGRLRDHRDRHRARRAGDDGPGVRAGGRSLDLRGGLSHRRGGGAAGGARWRFRCGGGGVRAR